ncbi:glycosyltransferase family 2 protein [Pseudomonas fulva]|uniref:glycosyltransferase family 2 protein n=1 Tax=Pseudomonas fulva TaxID=47880 RepID=UPI003D05B8DE
MIGSKKTGCGIVTYNRPDLVLKLYESLPHHILDVVYVVNDGQKFDALSAIPRHSMHHNIRNLGVGRSKNIALQYLLDEGCEHIFLIEDDIFIKDGSVFEAYIDASSRSGIQHLNFSQHGRMNKTSTGAPKPVASVVYEGLATIELYRHCVGAFSYYSRRSLLATGLMDLGFHNALEHVDHTLNIIKHTMHPPFWYFADIFDSALYIGDEEWSPQQSTISSSDCHIQQVAEAVDLFTHKHGCAPSDFPIASESEVNESLIRIKYLFGARSASDCSEAGQLNLTMQSE